METTDYTAAMPATLVDDLRKYAGSRIDEGDPHIGQIVGTLDAFALGGRSVGEGAAYLMRMSSVFLRRGTPNASYGCDTPWTVRGEAIDAQDKANRSLSEIIDWFFILAPKK